jgi:hypothetical protein
MNNLTRMNIRKPAHEVFEAFVDPAKIGDFWFSSSSDKEGWVYALTCLKGYLEFGVTQLRAGLVKD